MKRRRKSRTILCVATMIVFMACKAKTQKEFSNMGNINKRKDLLLVQFDYKTDGWHSQLLPIRRKRLFRISRIGASSHQNNTFQKYCKNISEAHVIF